MPLDDGGLLLSLHEGVHEKPIFDTFLRRLKARSRASYVSLMFRTSDDDLLVERYLGTEATEHFRQLFLERYATNPFAARHMRDGRIYSLDELFDATDPNHIAFRADLLAPQGLADMRSVRVTDQSSVEAWLVCSGGREIGASTGALLRSLVPHLRVAMRSFVSLDRARFRSRVSIDAFGRLNFGWLTLDDRCRVVDSANMERMFERSDLLRCGREGRLILASRAIDRAMTELVKRFASDPASRPKAFNLSRDPSVDLLLAPLHGQLDQASARPVAIAYVSGDRSSSADRCAQLADLFGLTPSEARLSWAMASGRSISEAACELGLSLETARNYSKKVYSKTGASGQPALVRIILTSVLAIV